MFFPEIMTYYLYNKVIQFLSTPTADIIRACTKRMNLPEFSMILANIRETKKFLDAINRIREKRNHGWTKEYMIY